MTTVHPAALATGACAALAVVLALQLGDPVPRVVWGTALGAAAAAGALTDVALGGRGRRGLGDRALWGRVAVAVTCPLAVVLAAVGPAWDPALVGGLAFVAGAAAGGVAVVLRRR